MFPWQGLFWLSLLINNCVTNKTMWHLNDMFLAGKKREEGTKGCNEYIIW